ncbi:intercellular adhesion molecule 3 [Suncus etruscus]|uniref:intercellular adhesion molecule 3 n=1 Tax=Suncus etruscus TaxID=109475 RepID=UPI002110E09F|nr:intercellular adhesion molecule 3 [Suncus etruscus]
MEGEAFLSRAQPGTCNPFQLAGLPEQTPASCTKNHLMDPACPPQGLCPLLLTCLLILSGAWGFQVYVEPQDPLVLIGEPLVMNCSTDCPLPASLILETFLFKETVDSGPGWETFRLTMTEDSAVICAVNCQGQQLTNFSSISTYSFPASVDLAPFPPWLLVGENLTVRCLVEGGTPRTQLTVVLLRGDEELSRQPAVEEPAQVTTTVLALREHHGASFSCLTELDLRSRGLGLFQNSSAPQQLRTYALPDTGPRYTGPRLLEVGKPWNATCSLEGLFPVFEARVQMLLGNHMLHPTVHTRQDTVEAFAQVPSQMQEGPHELLCSVNLGPESRESRENLTFYSFSGPNLTLSESDALEGSLVNVTCTAGARVRVSLDEILAPGPGQPVHLKLNATELKDKHVFICNATLNVKGMLLHRVQSAQLRVRYGPKIDRAKCPQHLIWKEDTFRVLNCQARGNPDPLLKCLQNNSRKPVPVGISFFVTSNYSGTYLCQATNSLGTYTLTVEIKVQGEQKWGNPMSLRREVSLGGGETRRQKYLLLPSCCISAQIRTPKLSLLP